MKYLIIVLMLLFGTVGWSQSLKFLFRGRVENIDLGKNEGGVTISIVQGGSSVASTTSSSNGKYSLKGDVNYTQPFDVVFTKSGLVSKKVAFDFTTLNEEDTPAAAEFKPVESLDIQLFKERENVDFSFLETEPVAAFTWNQRKMAPNLDGAVVSRMKSKIEALLNQEEKIDAEYQAAIQAGDEAFEKKEYESALASFEKAVELKPNEKYPNDKILELDALIAAQKEAELEEKQANQEYYNLIDAADNLRDAGDLQNAVAKYKEASSKKSDEQYPKDQIAALQAQIEAQEQAAADEEAYKEAIKMGDVFMKQNSLRPARDKFEEASKLKPEEEYPKKKLAEIDEKMAALEEQEALKEKYKEAIAAGDKAYDSENFQEAKDKYEEALTYESSSTYAKGRIEMCDEALASSKEEEERLAKIQELLDQGNADLSASKYEEAVSAFEEVLTLDAENSEATAKLAEAQEKLKELENEAEREKQYAALISEGDEANTANNLEDALSKYQSAKALKDTPEVNEKIAGVQAAINSAKSEAEKEEKYNSLIAEAETKAGADDLSGAIAKYNEAATVDPSKTEPAEKIAELQAMLEERAADQEKEEQFATLMKEGNDLLAANDLQKAKAKFEEAKTVDSSSPEPQAKIDEIDALIAQNAEEQQKQEELLAAIDAGDNAFNASNWDDAQDKYNEALAIDPTNKHAIDRIAEIDSKKAEEEVNNQVASLLEEGKSLRDDSKLEDARSKFQEVLALDPSNSEATTQISEINAELAAAQNESEKGQAFADLTAEAEQLFNDDKLSEAKQKYNEALSFKDDAGVKQKITEIDELIAEREAQEALEKEQAAIEEEYSGFIQEAEANEASKNYAAAVSAYQNASGVKPNEDLPKQKIKELNELIAEEQANASVNDQYDSFISEAEGYEADGNLESAITSYQKAKDVKPEETLPDTKIAELNALIAEKAENQAQIDKDYAEAMERGEDFMKGEKYLDAIAAFNEALALKPMEQEPKDRAAAAEEAERQKGDGEAQYEKILTVAESKIEGGDYDKAEELIGRAKKLKPEDTRPDQLLEKVNTLRERDKKYDDLVAKAESEAKSKNYQEAIAQFEKAKLVKPSESLPDERITTLKELLNAASSEKQEEAMYTSYMEKGNAAMSGDKFVEALGHYQNALSVKPGDQVAQDKVNEVQQILDDIANADKEKLEKKKEFDALIKEGENLFASEQYMEAKTKFDAALKINPYSNFAKEKSDECVKMEQLTSEKQEEEQYQKLLAKADEVFENEEWEKAKDYYNRAINVRGSDPYPKEKLKEIELILNPPIAKSTQLEDLGDEFTGSIEDGSFVIQTSEDTKILNKGIRIQEELSKAESSQSGIAAQNQDERLGTQNEIYAIWEKVAVSTEGADDSREATVEELRKAERLRSESQSQSLAYEKGDNLKSQERLNLATEEFILNYKEDESSQQLSREKVKNIQTAEADERLRQGGKYIQRKYEADQAMNQVAIRVEEDVKDDYEERLEIDREVGAAADETSEIYKAIGESKYENVQREKAGIELVYAKQTTKAEEGRESVKENNEVVKDVRSDVNTVALAYMQQNDEHAKVMDAQIAEVERKVISNNEGFDKVRKEANERLKGVKADQVEMAEEANEGQKEKYLANQQRLNDEEEKRTDIVEKAEIAMDSKIAYVNEKDRQAHANDAQSQLSDTEQRLNAKQKIENQELARNNKAKEDVKAHVENVESLKDVQRANKAKSENEAQTQKNKNIESQQSLNKIDGSPKEKVRIKNSLGQEYPEGVSQEMFSRKDEAGLITTVITRRVVVIDGHADVYTRTETKNGITYTKNGKPSLSHVWNSETQGPDLERHY